MKGTSKFLGPVSGLRMLSEVEGSCEKHGSSIALLPKRSRSDSADWYCATCAEEKRKADEQSVWLRERNVMLNRIAMLPERYAEERFEAVSAKQKEVRATARAFRDLIARELTWAVLILVGNPGTGKTLLACELAQSLIDKAAMSVRYCTAIEMIAEIQTAAYNVAGKSESSEVQRFTRYDLLILDEIDLIRSTENASLLLYQVINSRYNTLRPLVVMSNTPLEMLGKFIGRSVNSRLREKALICVHDWPDQRPLTRFANK